MRPVRFNQARLALAAALTVALSAGFSSQARAQAGAGNSTPLAVSIPAQPLAQALNELARQANLQLSFPPGLVAGKTAPGVSGTLTARQALDRLLSGSGLVAETQGSVVVVKHAPAAITSGPVLPTVTVRAGAEPLPGDLPKPYAGGQVARGGRVGVLGNVDFMDAPYSTQSFTREFIDNKQAQLLIDVVKYDASVLVINDSSRGYGDSNFYLRGFQTNEGNASFNGLFGLLTYGQSLEDVERVDVIKGPSAFANGAAGALTVGGLVNFVPKRALDEPLTRFTARYEARGNVGGHLDIGRRFGTDNAFGIRVNAAYRDGEGAVEDASKRYGVGSMALDYRGEQARLSLDLGYNNNYNVGYDIGLTIPASLQVPRAPDAAKLLAQPWVTADQKQRRAVFRGEWDLGSAWTAGFAYGAAKTASAYAGCDATLLNSSGDYDCSGDSAVWRSAGEIKSAEVSLNGKVSTGSVRHSLTFAATRLENEGGLSSFLSTTPSSFPSNLYNPIYTTTPSIPVIGEPPRTSLAQTSGLVAADQISFLEDRVLLTVAARRVEIKAQNFNASSGATTSSYSKSATVPGVGLLVKPWNNISLYGNYIEALERGGTAPGTAVNAGEVFPPLKSRQVETGVKIDQGTFATTLALFKIQKGNQYTEPASNRFVQDGRQDNQGVEVSVFGEPMRGVRVFGGLMWLDAALKKTAGGAFDGNTAPAIPGFQASLSGEWDLRAVPGLTLTGGMVHVNSAYVNNANTQQIPGWTRFDLGARYTTKLSGKAVTTRLSVNNVTNKNYWASVFRSGEAIYPGSPRTVVLSATVDF